MENQGNSRSTTGQVVDVESGMPEVSASKGSRMIFIVGSSVFAAIVFYIFIFGGAEEAPKEVDLKSEVIEVSEKGGDIAPSALDIAPEFDITEELSRETDFIGGLDVPDVPDVPEVPELPEEVKLPEPPKKVVSPAPEIEEPVAPVKVEKPVDKVDIFTEEDFKKELAIREAEAGKKKDEEEGLIEKIQRKKALKERRGAGIFIQGGASEVSLMEEYRKNSGIVSTEVAEISSLEITEGVKTSTATRIPDMSVTLLQGKLIDAVLETAINTDLEGTLRGIVSRDVYAELGTNVLIPKGSRLIGSYTAGAAKGQSRLLITWNRIIRPDGVDIRVNNANSVDQFGHSGVAGDVDDKFRYALMNSALVSAIAIAGAKIEQEISDTVLTQTTSVDGGTTQLQGSATDYAIIDAVKTLTEDVSDFFDDYYETNPTITIPQGTKLKVFVNEDLVLPPAKRYASKIIIDNK